MKFRIYFPSGFTEQQWKDLWIAKDMKNIYEEFPEPNYWSFKVLNFKALPMWLQIFIKDQQK